MPISHLLQEHQLLFCCSAKNGKQRNGTPQLRLSSQGPNSIPCDLQILL
jgi:hypothetical protein